MENSKKMQSMKYQNRAHFVYNIILYSLTSLITFIFFSYTFWFPSIYRVVSSITCDHISLFIDAKVFFVVGNLIVLFLVRDSKLAQSRNTTPPLELYDEYVYLQSRSTIPNIMVRNYYNKREEEGEDPESIKKMTKRIERKKKQENDEILLKIDKKKENIMRKSKSKSNLQHLKRQENKLGLRASKSEVWNINEENNAEVAAEKPKEEQLCISTEDLNKRVEAFIARVNKQRLLES